MNEDGSVVACDTVTAYASSFSDKVIAQDKCSKVFVSTVFLVVDHGFGRYGDKKHKPVLWETMIFGGINDQYQTRYTSLEEARAGHEVALQLVLDTEPKRLPRKKKKKINKGLWN